jgi:tyrosyl-DNA phosphodiesterase-1
VASVAGKHEGWPDVIRTGHPRLMKAVREIGFSLPPGQTLNVECQGSSIGTYSTQWINEFVDSCRGLSAETWLDLPKSRRMKLPYPKGLKILFPSLQTVRASRLGEDGGGTMFCRRQQWEGAKFPRELFHDSNSKRGKVLMHSKVGMSHYLALPYD